MKIVVDGLWHLGLVTAAGLLRLNNEVICYSSSKKLLNNLNKLKLPIFEQGLEKILKNNLNNKKLIFSDDEKVLQKAKVYWYCLDTPVNNNDEGTDFLFEIDCPTKEIRKLSEMIYDRRFHSMIGKF